MEPIDIRLIIDKDWPKLSVFIKNRERNEEVEDIIAALMHCAEDRTPKIAAFYLGSLVMLPQRSILRLFLQNRKVMLQTAERIYEVKKTMQEMEGLLDDRMFVRISQSETINLRRVKSFDFSTAGTIGVELENGERTWVSRRRVKSVKALLEREGKEKNG